MFDDDQQHTEEQAESISENFFDEVRQLIEQKLGGTASEMDYDLSTTEMFGHHPEERVIETTIPAEDEDHSKTIDLPRKQSSLTYSRCVQYGSNGFVCLFFFGVFFVNDNLAVYSPKPIQVTDWPKLDLRLGQVVAVSIGTDGHPVIFHRADRIWTDEWVSFSHLYGCNSLDS